MESISILYALLPLFLAIVAYKFLAKTKRKLPPSPFPTLPLLGHLHLLKFPIHRTYHDLSQKLGPVFSLRLGTRLVVVVSSPAVVEECFTRNDVVLANRPRFTVGKYIGYNNTTLVNVPYGEYWRNLRRLATVEIFSSSRLNMFRSVRDDEIRLMLQKLCRNTCRDFDTVELRPLLFELTFNNIMRMVAGKRYFGGDEVSEEAKEFRELIGDVFSYASVANPADFFPPFRWIDYNGLEKNLARISGKMDVFSQGLIDEQRRNGGGNTLIHHLLSLQEAEPQLYTDTMIKSLIVVCVYRFLVFIKIGLIIPKGYLLCMIRRWIKINQI